MQLSNITHESLVSVNSELQAHNRMYTNMVLCKTVSLEERGAFEAEMSRVYGTPLQIMEAVYYGGPVRPAGIRPVYRPNIYISRLTKASSLSTGYIMLDTMDPNYIIANAKPALEESYRTGAVVYYTVYGAIAGASVASSTKRLGTSNYTLNIAFRTQMWLDRIFSGSDNILITTADSSVASGVLTIYRTNNKTIGGRVRTTQLSVLSGTWHVTVWSTDDSRTALNIIAPCVIGTFFFVMILLRLYYDYRVRKLEELPYLKRIETSYGALSTLIHEVRNSLNIPMFILTCETIDDASRASIRDSIKQVIEITSNFLTYDKLLRGICEIHQREFDVHEFCDRVISPLVRNYSQPLSVTVSISKELRRVMLDADKYTEVFNNLFANSVKNAKTGQIVVRIRLTDGPGSGPCMLTEIINECQDFPVKDTELLYVPYFMRSHDELWTDLKRRLALNTQLRASILPYVEDPTTLLHDTYTIVNDRVSGIETPHIKSVGLGLSIVRLLCKAMGGDSNIERVQNYVNQWALVKVGRAQGAPDGTLTLESRV